MSANKTQAELRRPDDVVAFLVLMFVMEHSLGHFTDWIVSGGVEFDQFFKSWLEARKADAPGGAERGYALREICRFLRKRELPDAEKRNFTGFRANAKRMAAASAEFQRFILIRNRIMHGTYPQGNSLDDTLALAASLLRYMRHWALQLCEKNEEPFNGFRYFGLDEAALGLIARDALYPQIRLRLAEQEVVTFYRCPFNATGQYVGSRNHRPQFAQLWISDRRSRLIEQSLDRRSSAVGGLILSKAAELPGNRRVSPGDRSRQNPPGCGDGPFFLSLLGKPCRHIRLSGTLVRMTLTHFRKSRRQEAVLF